MGRGRTYVAAGRASGPLRSSGRREQRCPDVVHGGAIRRPAASVNPPHPAFGIEHDIAAELAWILAYTAETPPPAQGARQAYQVPRVEDRARPRDPSEPEHVVGDTFRVAQDGDVQAEAAFERRDRCRGRERDPDHASRQAVSLCSDLHEVLVAGNSAEMAHEHQYHRLASELRQPYLPPVRGGKDEVRDRFCAGHGLDSADPETHRQAGAVAQSGWLAVMFRNETRGALWVCRP